MLFFGAVAIFVMAFTIPIVVCKLFSHCDQAPAICQMASAGQGVGCGQPTEGGEPLEKEVQRFLRMSTAIATLVATIWAIQSYWRLVIRDERDKQWRPSAIRDVWSGPYAFHSLAQSHKEWAQLWFSWCIAIFLGGVTYATFTAAHAPPLEHSITWPAIIYELVTTHMHHGFVYALFGFAWYWASKHYRSHWHNYVVNAYRHRALYRFQNLRDEIWEKIYHKSFELEDKARETILELYRLSGVLLLIPGDSSYLDKNGGQEISAKLLQMEEVASVFRGKHGGSERE